MKRFRFKGREGFLLAIILKENRSNVMLWVRNSVDNFSLDNNFYFVVSDGVYINNGTPVAVYLEGVSVPIHHGYIERVEETRKFTDRVSGKVKETVVSVIKSLKFDSKLIDMLLNRNLADQFTKAHLDVPNLILTVLLICTVALGFVNVGLHFL